MAFIIATTEIAKPSGQYSSCVCAHEQESYDGEGIHGALRQLPADGDRVWLLTFVAVDCHPQRNLAGDDLPSESRERVLDQRGDLANRLDADWHVWDDTRRWFDDGQHFG